MSKDECLGECVFAPVCFCICMSVIVGLLQNGDRGIGWFIYVVLSSTIPE